MSERVAELKIVLEERRANVAKAQDYLAQLKAHGSPRERVDAPNGYWSRVRAAKRHLSECLERLRAARADIVRVSGTTGSDPRWTLIRDAWRLLQRLEDDGVDLGEDGQKLLDEIEFHVPASRLAG